jgi:flagellin-like protein
MKKWIKSKQGISPILATLLLIVIAVAAIVVTYAWVMMYMGTAAQQAGVYLKIDNVQFYGSPTDAARNRTKITVRNIGDSSTVIIAVYIGSSSGNLEPVTSSSDLGSGKSISGNGGTVDITVNWPNDFNTTWSYGQRYYFKVVPRDGEAVIASFKPQ